MRSSLKYFLILVFFFLLSLYASFDQTPPASPKTAEGYQRQLSDATAGGVYGVSESDASQQPRGAHVEAALNQ